MLSRSTLHVTQYAMEFYLVQELQYNSRPDPDFGRLLHDYHIWACGIFMPPRQDNSCMAETRGRVVFLAVINWEDLARLVGEVTATYCGTYTK